MSGDPEPGDRMSGESGSGNRRSRESGSGNRPSGESWPGDRASREPEPSDQLADTLRAAGCVFAEEEAPLLRGAARDAGDLEALTRRRVAGEPLEHVLGVVEFMGLRLRIGPGVFVPRQRTRLLAGAAIAAVRAAGSRPVFVEAFAGVAPVATAVLRAEPRAEIHATDLDAAARAFARANLRRSPGTHAAGIHAGSVLSGLPEALRGRVDVISAVPPYIPSAASGLLPREAREHEPPEALFGGEDGLGPARGLFLQAREWLAPAGRLLVEMNRGQCPAAAVFAERLGYDAAVRHGSDGQTAVLDLHLVRARGSSQISR